MNTLLAKAIKEAIYLIVFTPCSRYQAGANTKGAFSMGCICLSTSIKWLNVVIYFTRNSLHELLNYTIDFT
jgi:hypothetical protein